MFCANATEKRTNLVEEGIKQDHLLAKIEHCINMIILVTSTQNSIYSMRVNLGQYLCTGN